jgi:hypothetical protein
MPPDEETLDAQLGTGTMGPRSLCFTSLRTNTHGRSFAPWVELAEDLDHSSVPCRVVLSDPPLLMRILVASTRGFPWCEALNHGAGLF